MRRFLCLLVLLGGCAPDSLEDFRHEGEALLRALTEELQHVQTREELLEAAPKLRSHFAQLADLMIQARQYQQKHPEEDLPEGDAACSAALYAELVRIYRIEGGREIVEKAQRESLLRLDAFELALAKQRESFRK
jgi:hypothetical protein